MTSALFPLRSFAVFESQFPLKCHTQRAQTFTHYQVSRCAINVCSQFVSSMTSSLLASRPKTTWRRMVKGERQTAGWQSCTTCWSFSCSPKWMERQCQGLMCLMARRDIYRDIHIENPCQHVFRCGVHSRVVLYTWFITGCKTGNHLWQIAMIHHR